MAMDNCLSDSSVKGHMPGGACISCAGTVARFTFIIRGPIWTFELTGRRVQTVQLIQFWMEPDFVWNAGRFSPLRATPSSPFETRSKSGPPQCWRGKPETPPFQPCRIEASRLRKSRI